MTDGVNGVGFGSARRTTSWSLSITYSSRSGRRASVIALPTVVFVSRNETTDSDVIGTKGRSRVIGIVERSDMICTNSARVVPEGAVSTPGSGSASRPATSISRVAGRGAIGLGGAESGGGSGVVSAGFAVDLPSGSSAPPPRIRSNLASGSVVEGGVGLAAGASFTSPSGSLPDVGVGAGAWPLKNGAADDAMGSTTELVTAGCAESFVVMVVSGAA